MVIGMKVKVEGEATGMVMDGEMKVEDNSTGRAGRATMPEVGAGGGMGSTMGTTTTEVQTQVQLKEMVLTSKGGK